MSSGSMSSGRQSVRTVSEMSARPNLLVVMSGTGTDVGKTFVGAALLTALRADGWAVAARKPAQAFDPLDDAVHDADVLGDATGEDAATVCPQQRNYAMAMAPPMAAEALGAPSFGIAELAAEIAGSWPQRRPDVGAVELAGGVASPMAIDGDGTALCDAIGPDLVVVVADAALGVINSVRLTVDALTRTTTRPIVVHLNRFDVDDDLHRRNRDWLRDRDGMLVTTDIDALTAVVVNHIPAFCAGCGQRSDACDGGCRLPFDPDRYCDRCGRAMVVRIIPTGHRSACKVHGLR